MHCGLVFFTVQSVLSSLNTEITYMV